MAGYEIRSFHLNIDEGDSAVHYRSQTNAASNISTVEHAVLIDGGLRSSGQAAIAGFFKAIENSTELQPSQNRTLQQMDAIVVTHWDQDHVAGLEGIFSVDLVGKLGKVLDHYSANGNIPSNTQLQKIINKGVPVELMSDYILFSNDLYPRTQLWCPYWDVDDSLTRPRPAAVPSKNLGLFEKGTGNYFIRLEVTAGADEDSRTVKIPILKLEFSGQELIGRDLFDGDEVIKAEDARSPKDIAVKLNQRQKPAMVCIAADFGTCDPGGALVRYRMSWVDDSQGEDLTLLKLKPTSATPISSSDRCCFLQNALDEMIQPQSVNGPTTPNNQASVACMIIWPLEGQPLPRISHYFAGDIGAREFKGTATVPNDIEERILRWSTVPAQNNSRVQVAVESMKLSHHGGKYSTPLKMFFVWRPQYIIGSNGMRKSYNHCSWETILLVWMYTIWRHFALGSDAFPLFCTNLPIYLVNYQEYKTVGKGKKSQMQIEYAGPGSMSSLWTAGGKSFRQLWKDLSAMYPQSSYFPSLPTPSTAEQKEQSAQTICTFIAMAWDYVSSVKKAQYSLSGQVTNAMIHACEQNIRYIKIVAAYGSSSPEGQAISGNTMGDTDPDYWSSEDEGVDDPDDIVEGQFTSNTTRQSIRSFFRRTKQSQRTHSNGRNDLFRGNVFGVNRKLRPQKPACTKTAFQVLSLSQDPKDGGNGEDDDETSLQRVSHHDEKSKHSYGDLQPVILNQRSQNGRIHVPSCSNVHLFDDTAYLVASDAIVQPSLPPVKRLSVLASSNLDCFLGALTTGSIVLVSSPIDQVKSIRLDERDEMYQWITAVFGKADSKSRQMSASTSIADGVTLVSGFSYTTQLQAAFTAKSRVRMSQDDNLFFNQDIIFDSDKNKDAFGVPEGTWPSDTADVVGPGQLLCLSMTPFTDSTTTPTTVSASGLLLMLGMDKSKVIDLLTGDLILTLDMSKGKRNTIWFVPDAFYTTTLRLEFIIDTAEFSQSLVDFLGKTIGNKDGINNAISLPSNVRVVTKKTWRRKGSAYDTKARASSELTLVADFVLDPGNKKVPVRAAVAFGTQTVRWSLIFGTDDNQKSVSDLVAAVCSLFKVDRTQDNFKLEKYLPGADQITLRRVDYESRTVKTVTKRSLAIIVQVNFAGMVFLCTFTLDFDKTLKLSLHGSLFSENRPDPGSPLMTWLDYMPGHEEWTTLYPVRKGAMALEPDTAISDVGDLQALFSSLSNPPAGGKQLTLEERILPPAPIQFQLVSVNFALDAQSLAFSAVVGSKNPDKSTAMRYAVPVVNLMTAILVLNVDWSKKSLNELSIATRTELTSPKTTETVLLNLNLGYYQQGPDSTWKLSGGLLGMSGSFIYTLFDDDCNLEIVELLQHMSISFDIEYVYNKEGLGSLFAVNGRLHIGTFNLDLSYIHNGKSAQSTIADDAKPVWTFDAGLSSETQVDNTLLGFLSSLCGEDLTNALPSFLTDIKVTPNADSDLTHLRIVSTNDALVFAFRLQLTDGTSIAFYQLQQKRASRDAPVAPTKRILMFSMNKLPSVDNIPIIGKLDQPFDEMLFFWASNGDVDSTGISQSDLKTINDNLPPGFAKVLVKDIVKTDAPVAQSIIPCSSSDRYTLQREDSRNSLNCGCCSCPSSAAASADKPQVVLANGFHFCLIRQDIIALDYAFGGKKKAGIGALTDDDKGTPTSTPVDKKLGPVTISAITLDFDIGKQTLTLKLNGTLRLGPLELSLIGFGVAFDFTGTSLKGSKLPSTDFSLKGLALAFQREPITIAGMFERGNGPTPEEFFYKGAAAIGFTPWLFEGGGYYGVSRRDTSTSHTLDWPEGSDAEEWLVIDPYKLEEILQVAQHRDFDLLTDDTFKSFFAFARLSGPIATVGFAEITDVSGGFGYNTTIAFPTMQNIKDFPFFKSPGDGGIANALTKFLNTGWIANKEGSNWVAAGLTVNAFQTLTVTAVIVVEFGASVKLGIFGLATAEIPRPLANQKEPPLKFAVVQLGVSATYDFGVGILKIDGQLTPASFILDPSCHLSGGFALYSWLSDRTAELQGDFVFTIGGYHPSYSTPAQYPTPPRLGISWNYDPSINISGQAYFAITPKVCMGGGSLHVTLSLGSLYAFFDAWADFLINYRPFQYQASGGIAVGVHYTLDLWLVSIPINIHLGAYLYLQGPPLSGRVHVDFYVFGFDVNFGTHNARAAAKIAFEEFYKLAIQASNESSTSFARIEELDDNAHDNEVPSAQDDDINKLPVHVISCLNGLIPDATDQKEKPKGSPWVVQGSVFAFSVSSKFAIGTAKVVTSEENATRDVPNPVKKNGIYAIPMGLANPFNDSELTIIITPKTNAVIRSHPFRALALSTTWENNVAQTRNLPNALWAKYDPDADPSGGNNSSGTLLNGQVKATTPFMTGVQLSAPTGGPSEDLLVPFNVEKVMSERADTVPFQKIQDANNSLWNPEEPKSTSKEQYAVVKDAWTQAAVNVPDVLDFWAKLTWNMGGEWAGVDPNKIGVPEKLRTGLDEYFVEAPRITLAEVA